MCCHFGDSTEEKASKVQWMGGKNEPGRKKEISEE